ncbi:hypothetical protein D1O30_19835 [Methylocystis hirsuta]|uniref:Uncharacterized protein n=1 Tax=Methylocystis hirsuta TaxID=369798 RepID=A0A3M9XIW8_9HYPH|nr:hypothetical protein D1O30_19835 [Methylocystis hirsuta]
MISSRTFNDRAFNLLEEQRHRRIRRRKVRPFRSRSLLIVSTDGAVARHRGSQGERKKAIVPDASGATPKGYCPARFSEDSDLWSE